MSALTERAMTVRISISQPSMSKYDRQTSGDIAEQKRADPKSVRAYKQVLETDGMIKFRKTAEKLRFDFYELTLPWLDGGLRMATPALFEEVNKMFGAHKRVMEEAIAEFKAEYPAAVQAAKTKLGDMYNPADYPPVDQVVRRFGVYIQWLPVPAIDDFRVTLTAKAEAEVKRQTEEFMREAEERAMADLCEKATYYIGRMAEALANPDKRFHDTLVSNVAGAAELLPKLNVAGNAEMDKFAEEIRLKLCSQQPGTLREDKQVRAEVGRNAQDIYDRMVGVFSAPDNADSSLSKAA